MLANQYNRICCICGEAFDSNKIPAIEYAIHGKGKNKTINYFHYSCYYKEVNELRKKVYNDYNI